MKSIYKIILISIGLLVLFSVAIISCNSHKATTKKDILEVKTKPNIIYIMADDLTTQAISAYGGIYKDIAPTPNIDRIANQGMLFQDVLCTNAICGPSRSAILTGNYSNKNGYYKNESGGQFNAKQWTFPQEFQKNGYQTSLFGKWHLGSDPVGFDEFMFHSDSRQQGFYWNPTYNHNGKLEKKQGYATNLSTDAALNWLKTKRTKEKPFLMLLQYKAPHRSWDPDTPYENLWDDVEFPYPSTFNDNYKGRELTAGNTEMTMEYLSRRDMKMEAPNNLQDNDLLRWNFYGSAKNEIVQPKGMTNEEGRKWRYQKYIKDYLACVKSVDDNVGRVLDYLKANNLEENTVIIITSDQGFYLGDHGFFDKRFIYEESLRMPFIIKYPNVVKAGTINNDITSNIDFAPTLLDIAHIKTSTKMQGKSFATLFSGKTPKNWRQSMYYHYYEWPFWHHVQPHYGIRTQKYTLAHFYYNIDVWELYDLEKDPTQIHNIYNDPQYTNIVSNLKSQLKDLMIEYDNNKSLSDFRKISDTDFGKIVNDEEDIEKVLNRN